MKTLRKLTLAIAMITALPACSSVTGGQLIREGEPVGIIRVSNGSNQTITAITISECSAFGHGMNRLPSGLVLEPRTYYDFRVSYGCYDVQAGYGHKDGTGSYSLASQRMEVRGAGVEFTVTN